MAVTKLVPHFILFSPLLPKEEENRGNCTLLVVLTPKQAPLLPPPPLPPSSLSSPPLLPWPISAEQWSVKKFPISKFTHCINLV